MELAEKSTGSMFGLLPHLRLAAFEQIRSAPLSETNMDRFC